MRMERPNDPHLFKRTVAGIGWVAAMRVAAQLLSTVRLFVLAWFLAPGDFGLMGIALVTLSLLETFTETGFIYALVQKHEVDRADLDSAWSISLLRGIAICVAMCLAAPLVAGFFEHSSDPAKAQAALANHDLAVWVIRAFSLTIVFRCATNIGIVNFRRGLEFNKLFVIDTAGLVVDVAVAVVIAVIFKSVWALVCGKLASEAVRAVMSYMVHPYRPSFHIDRARCDQLWGFGKWVFWSTAAFYFLSQGDSLVVVRLFGYTALGVYQFAGRLAALPVTEVSNVVAQVTFPVFSRIQNDLPRLRAAYIRVAQTIAFFSCPLAGLTAVFVPDIARIFLKPEWAPVVPVVQILAVNAFFMSFGTTFGPAFQAIGKPRTIARFSLVKLAVFAVLLYPFTAWWGMSGAAAAGLLATLSLQPLLFVVFSRMVGCRLGELIRACYIPCVVTLVAVAAVLAVKTFLCPQPSLFLFGLLVIMAIAVYAGGVLVVDRLIGLGLVATAKELAGELTGAKGGR